MSCAAKAIGYPPPEVFAGEVFSSYGYVSVNAGKSVRLVPVPRGARIDGERNLHRKRRHRRILHGLADDGDRGLDLGLRRLEDQLVMDLKQHLRGIQP